MGTPRPKLLTRLRILEERRRLERIGADWSVGGGDRAHEGPFHHRRR